MKFFGIALFTLVVLSACGKKEDFKYQYTVNGCDTGEHKAESKEEFCSLLKNDEINNYCAYNVRKENFQTQGCGNW